MSTLTPDPPDGVEPARRVPVQERSRRRVEAVLDAAAALVVATGVEELTTRDIATAADVPVASIYQYFADKEAVLLALAARDMAEMDAQLATDLAALRAEGTPDLAAVVRTAMTAFVTVYHRRRAFVEIYLRGRTNVAVSQFGRDHNRRIAGDLLAFAREVDLAGTGLTRVQVELAVEVGDRVFQLAFEHDPLGDPVLVEEGIVLVAAYLQRYTR